MSEGSTEFPNQVQQLTNFFRSLEQTKTAFKDYSPSMLPILLKGLLTIIPDKVVQSGILKDNRLQEIAGETIAYFMNMNDRIDYQYSGREDLQEKTKGLATNETAMKQYLDILINSMDDPAKAFQIKSIINNASAETEIIEQDIRSKGTSITMADADKYRNLVNAVQNVAVAGIIFGNSELGSHLETIPNDKLTFEAIEDKYQWVFEEKYTTPIERAIKITHNSAMAFQVVDDWYGKDIDHKLNIPSLALTAIHENSGDEKPAKQKLNDLKDSYLSKAKNLGLGFVPAHGATIMSEIGEKGMIIATKILRRQNELRQKIGLPINEAHRFYPREKDYITGKL